MKPPMSPFDVVIQLAVIAGSVGLFAFCMWYVVFVL